MHGSGLPWATGGPAGSRTRLHGAHRCDVAVIGAGLTGCATALELTRLDPDLTITVLEADQVAAGASGRGTGLLGPRIGPALTVARRRYGDDIARAAHLWSQAAVQHVLDLVERHRIGCDLTPGSQLVVARGATDSAAQHREADAARALGLPAASITMVEPDALPALARGYTSGLRYAPAATLDPAALTGQLARLGEQRGVTIFERSPVRRISRGLRTTLVTDDGEVSATHAVVAVNAYGAPLRTPAGVVGLRVQAAVSEKLPQDALDAVDTLRTEPLIVQGDLAPCFRLTPDGRIVVGGGAVERGPLGSVAPLPQRLRAALRGLDPALAAVEIEAAWAGPIGMTRDGWPVVGRHPNDPGLYYAGGCNGHGLAVSVYNAAQLARWIVHGQPKPHSSALPWMRTKAPWMPRGRLVEQVLDRYLAHLTAASDPAFTSVRHPAPRAAPR